MPKPPSLPHGLRALTLLFAGLGGVGGLWGAHIPSFKAVHGLSEQGLSWALFAGALGAFMSLWVSGRVVARLGHRRSLVATGLFMQASLAALLWWPHPVLLALALVAFGMAMSIHDVALNAEGSALEQALARPVMGRLHAAFSLGAMAGALAAAGLLRMGVSPPWQMAGLGLGLAALLLAVAPGLWNAQGASPHTPDAAVFVWPRGPLLALGLLILVGMLAEGVMYDWSVLYLQAVLQWPQHQAALGYAVFVGAMAATRLLTDRARQRWGDAALLQCSAVVATLSMALALLWVHPWGTLLALAGVGMGLAPVVPLLYAAAARLPGSTSAAALAAVSSIGYTGFVVGPPWIGFLAQRSGLPSALWTVVLA